MSSHPREQAATYNDIIAAAAGQLQAMHDDGHLSLRGLHALQAQLNSTLYTLAFALPAGTLHIQNSETGVIHETKEVEASDRKGKAKSIRQSGG